MPSLIPPLMRPEVRANEPDWYGTSIISKPMIVSRQCLGPSSQLGFGRVVRIYAHQASQSASENPVKNNLPEQCNDDCWYTPEETARQGQIVPYFYDNRHNSHCGWNHEDNN